MAPLQVEGPVVSPNLPFLCKRETSEDHDLLSLGQTSSKRAKHDDPNSSNANGSEDSTTTSQNPPTTMMMTKDYSPPPLEFSLLEPKESQPASKVPTLDSSNLEKSVPPGYLKFIHNLETEIMNVSMEKETLKIELMRAQAMINILQSRCEIMTRDSDDLRRNV